jgi:hypothetical protein
VAALADAIGLRTLPLGARAIDILHHQVQRILLVIGATLVLRAPIGQDAHQRNTVPLKEGEHAVVGHVRASEGGLRS